MHVQRLLLFIDYVNTWCGKLFAWIILLLTGVVCVEVFKRYILNSPTAWIFDADYMMYGTLFMMAGAYTLAQNGHVRGDFLYGSMKPRNQAWLDLILYFVFFLPGIGALVYAGFDFAHDSWLIKEHVSTTAEGPRVFRQPIRELETLHDREDSWTNRTLNAGQTLPLAPAGDLFRMLAEVTIAEGAALTLNVRGTKVVFTRNSIAAGPKPVPLSTALTDFEALVDRTSVEAFANKGEASMSKCFLPNESGLSLKAASGPVTIHRLKLVYLKSALK